MLGTLMRWFALCGLVGAISLSTGCPSDSSPDEGPVAQSDVPDTVTSVDSFLPPSLDCESDSDCQGLQGDSICSSAVCDRLVGQCLLFSTPGCCVIDSDCDDGDDKTTDTCNTELNVCQSGFTEIACQADLDCDTGESCILFECDVVCSYYKKPNCCTSDTECDDGDSCTTDRCNGFICTHEPSESAICCGDVVFTDAFSEGLSPESSVETNGADVVWQESSQRWRTPPTSAYFGNKLTGNYENGLQPDGSQAPSVGAYITQPVVVPSDGGTVKFSTWVDVEAVPDWDLFSVSVRTDSGPDTAIWSKSQLDPNAAYRTWVDIEADISSYAGTSIRFVFAVDTIDATVNTGEGIYIDDIVVVGACGTDPVACASDGDCDDGNVCTLDDCGADGLCSSAPIGGCCVDSSDCSDGDTPCVEFACIQNQCEPSTLAGCCQSTADCPILPCQTVQCELNTASCAYTAIDGCCTEDTVETACNDDDPCTADTCVNNQCTNTALDDCELCLDDTECSDGNPCTNDVCLEGACNYPVIPGCVLCESAADCSVSNPVCEQPECVGGVCALSIVDGCIPCAEDGQCNDSEPCTIDSCEAGYCSAAVIPNCTLECETGLDCNDDNPCTIDACNGGKCINGPIPDCCIEDSECQTSDPCKKALCENNVCTTSSNGTCGDCQSNSDCSDGDECTIDFCSIDTGECLYPPNPIPGCPTECIADTDCISQDVCTVYTCTGGLCQGASVPGCCSANSDCDDGSGCTTDTCDIATNTCTNIAIPGCGGCIQDSDCDDNNVCSIDSCQSGVCEYTQLPGCNPGCTTNADCVDGDPCTSDICGANGSCQHPAITGCCQSALDCDDSDPCTQDVCSANSTCQNTVDPTTPGCCASAQDCNDDNTCTVDSCLNNACTNTLIGNCCSANSDCQSDQPCQEGSCVAGQCVFSPSPGCCSSNADCDDGIQCTSDSCDVVTGQCVYQLGAGCCANDADCPALNACVSTACGTDNQCESSIVPGCCIANVECEDGDECTYNQCIDNQCVEPVDIPGCCFGITLGAENFDAGPLQGWDFELIGVANWQVTNSQALSPPNALWFGNALTGDFSEPADIAPGGTVTTSPYVIPADKYAKVTFSVWADIELPTAYDQVELRVIDESGDSTLVWIKLRC